MRLCRWILCAALVATPAFAQRHMGGDRMMFAWWDSPIAKDLNLTDDQQAKIKQTVKEYRSKLIDQRAAVEKAESDLDDIWESDKIDQKRASDALDRVNNARADMMRSVSQMSLKLRMLLTADQWKQLGRRGEGFGPRPGGPGFGGPGGRGMHGGGPGQGGPGRGGPPSDQGQRPPDRNE